MTDNDYCILLNKQGDEIHRVRIVERSRKFALSTSLAAINIFLFAINIAIVIVLAVILNNYTKYQTTSDAVMTFSEKVHPLEECIVLHEEFKNIKTRETYKDLTTEQRKFYSKLIMVVNYYDHICIGYNYGMYKEDLFERFVGNGIVDALKQYRHFIDISRKENRVHHEGWKEFENAASILAKKASK